MKEIGAKIGVIIIAFVTLIGVITLKNYKEDNNNNVKPKQQEEKSSQVQEPIKVSVSVNNEVQVVDLDSYLLGVVAGEMPASFELEALKAQVVASRTFVYARNLTVDNTTSTQVYLSETKMKENWGNEFEEKKNKIIEAINATKNEVMKYEGEYISALFFSSSNGKTENCGDYFQGDKPYLKSVDSHWDLTVDPKNIRQKTFTKSQLQELVGVSEPNINILSLKKSGYVDTLSINEKTYTGREIRELLGLSSSSFNVEYSNGNYIFTSSGSGHGVGMSQYGAQGMAIEGYNYKDILNHYYTNIEIVNN